MRHGLARLLIVAAVLAPFSGIANSAEPVPSLMKTLLGIFPEGKGWFVEGPLGATPETPKDIVPFYTQPRVIVPSVDDVEAAAGRLFAAGSLLPIRRVTRFDEKPGAKGLPGFRGIWCETESKDDLGFLILTPNQNRFLLWARQGYFPALTSEGIEPKVRDWYARSVADHLVSLDFRVPDNLPPRATERSLPDWMELYPALPPAAVSDDAKLIEFLMMHRELHMGQCQGVTGFIPTGQTIAQWIDAAPETLYTTPAAATLQSMFKTLSDAGQSRAVINPLTRVGFDSLHVGAYLYAIDRYGRVRITRGNPASLVDKPALSHALVFPGEPVLAAGWMTIGALDTNRVVTMVSPYSEDFACSRYSPTFRDDVTMGIDRFSVTMGHLFASLRAIGIPYDEVLIQKY